VTDPVITEGSIDADVQALDRIEKQIGAWTEDYISAEEIWDALYDATADDLKDQMREEGRKGDPAEHWVTSVCRRQHRVEYQNLRRAKKQLDGLQLRVKAKTTAVSGRQTQAKIELELSRSGMQPEPQRTGGGW
jgi:hypothetical protein